MEDSGMKSKWTLEGWYFRRSDCLLGPVTAAELELLVAGGRLRATDVLWQGLLRGSDRLLIPTVVRAALELVDPVPSLSSDTSTQPHPRVFPGANYS
jgi:hypothetical protein